jgi:TPR repeat protein
MDGRVISRLRITVVLLVILSTLLAAQSKQPESAVSRGGRFALVIGNSNYVELGRLKNPEADARDISAELKKLAFDVEMLINADLPTMEDAVIRLGNRLATSKQAIGFFFYAGHGVQSGGVNYLIPADARIPTESYLKTKALSAQAVLDTMQEAKNELNIVVLDACRDNPFSWARSGTRGLSVVGVQPPGSIVVYSTSAGRVALDGTGRNGVFTTELLKHLSTPGVEVKELFNRTGAAVQAASGGKQVPAVYNQFFGTAYLSGNATKEASPQTSAALTAAKASVPPKALEEYKRGIEALFALDTYHFMTGEFDASLLNRFRPAADAGYPQALLWFGILQSAIESGKEDHSESRRWLQLSTEQLQALRRDAENGDAAAQLGLVFFLMEESDGKPANSEEVQKWCRLATDQGYPLAYVFMGSIAMNGVAADPDAREAVKWLRRAGEKGDTGGMLMLASLYKDGGPGLEKDAREAEKWYRKAIEKGNNDALEELASLYLNGGLGLEPDAGKVVDLYRMKAEKGDMDAMEKLADLYWDGGPGLPADAKKAAELYRQAIDKGRDDLLATLSQLYLEGGPGLPADAKKAAELYRQAIDKGRDYLLYTLARLYHYGGPGLEPDGREAEKWYRKAIEKEDNDALGGLARLYLDGGPGLPADAKKAAELYRQAIDKGYGYLLDTLAQLYLEGGPGLAPDARKVADLYRMKADKGDMDAMERLARLYLEGGPGLPADAREAEKWYRKAADLGSADAAWAIGTMYIEGNGVAVDVDKGITWCTKAANENKGGYYAWALAEKYYWGEGIPQDFNKAWQWYRIAADAGDADAQFRLGWMSYVGEGVRKDYADAARWWRLSAEQGNAVAQYDLGLMYLNGEGVRQDYVSAYMWLNLAVSRYDPGEDRDKAVSVRDDVARRMTAEQLAEAQRLTREWEEKFEAR